MGFKVPELSANSKAPLDEGKWDARFVKFISGESSLRKTPYVQVVWKITDEEAVDVEGEAYKRNLFGDTFYLTEAAMWRLKKFASEAEVEIPEAGDEYDSLAEYAADLTDAFGGVEATLTTTVEKYPSKADRDEAGFDEDDEDTWTGRKAVTVEVSF